jgi:FkbM family methyltransferase
MGIYEKIGVRNLALHLVDLINWIRLYGFQKGWGAFWNLALRKGPVYIQKNKLFPYPLKLRNNYSDKAIFKQVFLERQYDLQEQLLPSDVRTILDGGGNVGLASIYFARLYPEAEILTIEPERDNFELLKENTSYYHNISCIRAGIWRTNEPIHIVDPSAMAGSFSIGQGSENDKSLPGLTIDSIIKERKWDKIDILKLDIEGAEKEVFSADAHQWLDITRILIIELHDRYKPGCAKAFFTSLQKYDYDAYFFHENIFIFFNHSNQW